MGTNVNLTPELERFAQACVESGRFNNVSEVVRSGLRMLQEAEERRATFVRLDLAPERYRFWSLRAFLYLLVYDAEAEPPIILRFVHQSRDLPAVLDL